MADKKMVAMPPRDAIVATIEPALKVGTACGTAGFLFGGAAGIVKGTTPFIFASVSGVQTFALGAAFWATRSGIVQAWTPGDQQLPSADLIKASTIAGGVTGGAVALLTRGRANFLPGALMFSIFGFAGQMASNNLYKRREAAEHDAKPGFWRRMSDKPWSPVTVMSNEDYAKMLNEKLLRVDAEISIMDDRIAALKKAQEAQASEASSPKE
ncbi:uncharacterized protein LTR77_007374 [Saxophila tyrrhenica]|uniref:Uncharacterized protein n=1 Tax=Saxophila tyrrhenica TaxID=1690608 RepID=A0AAV9P8I5_9PEZI|nr:hypothetical protein LTR77_007374 [Saxophila tyrrhenica]